MTSQRMVRVAVVLLAVFALSVSSTLTAANVVPPSNAGVTSLPFSTACPFDVAFSFQPKTINSRNAHRTIEITVTFPNGLPAAFAGAITTSVELRLVGGTQTVSALPGGGPAEFTFSQGDVFDLIGNRRGDVVLEVVGVVGSCRFVDDVTIRANGPV